MEFSAKIGTFSTWILVFLGLLSSNYSNARIMRFWVGNSEISLLPFPLKATLSYLLGTSVLHILSFCWPPTHFHSILASCFRHARVCFFFRLSDSHYPFSLSLAWFAFYFSPILYYSLELFPYERIDIISVRLLALYSLSRLPNLVILPPWKCIWYIAWRSFRSTLMQFQFQNSREFSSVHFAWRNLLSSICWKLQEQHTRILDDPNNPFSQLSKNWLDNAFCS